MAAEAAPARPAPLPLGPRVIVTLALSMAVFMNVLDVAIANVSIPTIAGSLAVSAAQGTWVITSFAVANAIAVPISGWLARQVGEVRLFVICTLLFTFFSWLCGFSFSFPMLVTFRVLQGAVAGPMIPISQSLLLANYPPEQRGLANGIYGMTAVIGPIAGPVLGGWLTESVGWPWIFYINVPFGLAAAAITWTMLRNRETAISRQRVDGVGLGLLVVGVACLQIMLDNGNDKGWFGSTEIVLLTVVAVVALSFFVVWELTEENPIVELRLFLSRNFAVATVAMTLGYMAFFGTVVIFPLWLQTQMGYTAETAGIAVVSFGLIAFVASPIVGRMSDRIDARLLVTPGFLIFAFVSFTAGYNSTDMTFGQIFWQRLPWGLGTSLFFIPLITLSFSELEVSQFASASGLFNFLRQLGLGFGTSLSVTMWDNRASFHDHRLSETVNAFDPLVRNMVDGMEQAGMTAGQVQRR